VSYDQKRVGLLGIVGNDPVHNYKAGGIVLLNLDILKNPKLNELIELSKQNPGVVY